MQQPHVAAHVAAADSALCYGRLCSRHLVGLDLRHFPVAHAVTALVLLVASFLLHYTAAYHLLHPRKGLYARAAVAAGLSASYLAFVTCFIPWHPYWIRELHVMVACMFAWKAMELALLRRQDVLPALPAFLLNDALVLRPDVLQDPTVRRAKELAAKMPLKQRLRVALPQVAWCFIQYVGVEATNTILMRQPNNFLALPLWRQYILNVLFAECLYLHLSYFFSAMCVVNVVFFADAVEAWPPPFNKPFAAISPIDFWNRRWHGMFKWYFVQLVYRPTQALIHRSGKPSAFAKTLPTFAVFLVSGLFHEALLYINFGACTGEQLAFFLIHAVVLVGQRYVERAGQAVAKNSGQGTLQPGSGSSSYGSLGPCATHGSGCTCSAVAAQEASGQLQGQGQGSAPAQPLLVHITAKSVAASAGTEGTPEGSEEHDASGDDGSCCGSGPGAPPDGAVVKTSMVVPGTGAISKAVRRTNGLVAKGDDSKVHPGMAGSAQRGAVGQNGSEAQEGDGEVHVGLRRADGAAAGAVHPTPIRVSRKPASMSRNLQKQLLRLLLGDASESVTIQWVRYIVQSVLFNLFLGLTLSLFFAPWFRFGYHRELRVFVPGKVHDAVQDLVTKWHLGTVLDVAVPAGY